MQNIKRRVYDSLNVLIALGVIKRIGNKISKHSTNQKNKKIAFNNNNNNNIPITNTLSLV
jgi:hypothetical protein